MQTLMSDSVHTAWSKSQIMCSLMNGFRAICDKRNPLTRHSTACVYLLKYLSLVYHKRLYKKQDQSQAWWCRSQDEDAEDAEAEDQNFDLPWQQSKFKDSLGNLTRSCLNI